MDIPRKKSSVVNEIIGEYEKILTQNKSNVRQLNELVDITNAMK